MEIILQYFDDLDDLYGMVGLIIERLRRLTYSLFCWLVILAGASAGVWLALNHQPIALATSTLLFVVLLYRSATTPDAKWPEAT